VKNTLSEILDNLRGSGGGDNTSYNEREGEKGKREGDIL